MLIRIIETLKIGGVEKGILNELETIKDYKLIVIDHVKNLNVPEHLKSKITILNKRWYSLISLLIYSFSADLKGNYVVASLWKSFPFAIILSIVNNIKLIPFFHSDKFTNPLNYLASLCAINRASRIFVDSKAVKDKISKLNSSKEIQIIPFNFYKEIGTKPKDFNLGLKPIFIGRISKEKRVDLIVKLHKNLVREIRINKIKFFGPIEHFHSYEIIKNYDGAEYCGVVDFDKVDKKLNEFNCIFLLSDREGMAEVVFNAMAFGLVPLVRSVGEMKNYIQNKNNGFISDDLHSLKSDVVKAYNEKSFSKISENAKLAHDGMPNYIDEFIKYAK